MTTLKVTTPDCGTCSHPFKEHTRRRDDQSSWEAGTACTHAECQCDNWCRPAGVPAFSTSAREAFVQKLEVVLAIDVTGVEPSTRIALLDQLVGEMDQIVGEQQNAPPRGIADGSFTPIEWIVAQSVVKDLRLRMLVDERLATAVKQLTR